MVVFSTNDAVTTEHLNAKKKKKTDLIPFTKINSKLTTELNVRCKIMKLLEDSIGENLVDLEFGKKFLDTMPKQSMKEKYYC